MGFNPDKQLETTRDDLEQIDWRKIWKEKK